MTAAIYCLNLSHRHCWQKILLILSLFVVFMRSYKF